MPTRTPSPNPRFDYRSLLKQELLKRKRRNPLYSMRSFARDLQVTYSRLNEALNRKKGMSAATALKICERLGLSKAERELFIASIESQHARSRVAREQSKEALASLQKKELRLLNRDSFELIANWSHYAVLECLALEGCDGTPTWIARRLGLEKLEVDEAIHRLCRLGLLTAEADGSLRVASPTITSENDRPSEGLKLHHAQLLEKAQAALREQALDEREFQALTLAFAPEDREEAKAQIRAFIVDFNARFAKSAHKKSIYCLTTQFFRLDQPTRH